jgi:hypothetical protein
MSQFDSYAVTSSEGILGHRFSTEIGGNILDSKFDVDHIDVPPASDVGETFSQKISIGVGRLFGHKFHAEIGGGNLNQKFFVVTPRAKTHYIAASLTGVTTFVGRIQGVLKFDETSPTVDQIAHRFRVYNPADYVQDYHFVGASTTGFGASVTRIFGVNKFRLTSPNENVAGHKFHVQAPISILEEPADYHFVATSTTGFNANVNRISGVNRFDLTSINENVAGHKIHVTIPDPRCPNYNFVAASETGQTPAARIFGVNKFETSPDILGHEFDIAGIDVDGTKPQDLGQTFGYKFIVRGNFPGSQFGTRSWCVPPEFGVFTQESDWPTGVFEEIDEDC